VRRYSPPELRSKQEGLMSLSTAVIVNVVLDVVVLGVLGYVCRVPLRLGVEKAELRTPSRPPQHARALRAT
jgi:hypothetical protein